MPIGSAFVFAPVVKTQLIDISCVFVKQNTIMKSHGAVIRYN